MAKPKWGDRARDTVTGFEGIVTAKTEWMNGCVRYALQSSTLKDGVPVDAFWVDEQTIEVVKEEKIAASDRRGGPQRDPKF